MGGRAAVFSLIVMAVGCTPARFTSLKSLPEAERSAILVYRASNFNAGGISAIFGADRNDYLKLGNDTYAELLLVPNTYEFFVRTNQADQPYVLTVTLKQNEYRCLKAYPNPNNLTKAVLLGVGYFFGSTFLLEEVDCPSSQGIASYKKVAPKYESE